MSKDIFCKPRLSYLELRRQNRCTSCWNPAMKNKHGDVMSLCEKCRAANAARQKVYREKNRKPFLFVDKGQGKG